MKILTKRQILLLHEQLIEETGGTHGLRDEGLLESALSAPFQSFDFYAPYPTIQQKAARLGYGLVMELIHLILEVAAGKIGYEELLMWVLDHQQ